MKRAFSLVELSIVLVILGLLTGGILTGQSLIRAAELRSVVTEYNTYSTAVMAFRDKYFALPGDMNNATRFWGRLNANADCVTNSTAAVASPGACDGNGDGQLDVPANSSQAGESFAFWQQLANAGLIEGSYTGISGSEGSQDTELGENAPTSKVSNAGWYSHYWDGNNGAGTTADYAYNYGNHFLFGANQTDSATSSPVLTPEEAWNIDKKADDGLPSRGKIIARYWNDACSRANDGSHANNNFDASYNLTSTAVACAFRIRDAY